MPTTLQFRRGTTAQNNAFTGAAGELSVDSTLDTVRVHDGATAGGFLLTSRTSLYADIAERYWADGVYEPGTVLVFGGENEVTVSTQPQDTKFAGVVSTEPYAIMNSPNREPDLTDEMHPALALIGRVPCNVSGFVRKGDLIVTSTEVGAAMAWRDESNPPTGSVIGKSLEDKDDKAVGVIEVVVGVR